MTKVFLKDIGKIVTGFTPHRNDPTLWQGNIPFVTPVDLQSVSEPINKTKETIAREAVNSRLLPKNTVMVTCIGNLGRVGIAGTELITNQQINSIIVNESVAYPKYVFHTCCLLKAELEHIAPSTTLPIVKKSLFENLQIPLPPLEEQKRIAAILDKADAIKRKRQEAIRLADELLQSVFLDMFGDPVTNPKGWPVKKLEPLCKRVQVGVVIKPADYYTTSGVIALRSQNIKPHYLNLEKVVHVSEETNNGAWNRSRFNKGDIAIVRTGNPGTACVIPEELDGCNCIDLLIIRPNLELLNNYYTETLLNSEATRNSVTDNNVGIAQRHYNVGSLKEMNIILPPMELQLEFQRRYFKIRERAINYIKEQTLTDSLSQSLVSNLL